MGRLIVGIQILIILTADLASGGVGSPPVCVGRLFVAHMARSFHSIITRRFIGMAVLGND
jgi:hypothetical protein